MALIGFLLVIAYQQVVGDEPRTSRARADLAADVRHRQVDADTLQRRASTLRDQVARAGDAALAGEQDAADLRTAAAAAGLGRVVGAGAMVELVDAPTQVDPVTGRSEEDNPGAVLDRDLQDISNALWRLGAEAIAINGQRLTAVTTASVLAAVAVAVDAVGETVFPQRKQSAQLRAQLALGLVEKRREGVGDLGAAEALE